MKKRVKKKTVKKKDQWAEYGDERAPMAKRARVARKKRIPVVDLRRKAETGSYELDREAKDVQDERGSHHIQLTSDWPDRFQLVLNSFLDRQVYDPPEQSRILFK